MKIMLKKIWYFIFSDTFFESINKRLRSVGANFSTEEPIGFHEIQILNGTNFYFSPFLIISLNLKYILKAAILKQIILRLNQVGASICCSEVFTAGNT